MQTAITMRARSSDPATSHQAAANAAAFAGSQCVRILAALERLGSGTADDIGSACGLTVVQVDRRRKEMERAGLIRMLEIDGKPLVRNGYMVWALA